MKSEFEFWQCRLRALNWRPTHVHKNLNTPSSLLADTAAYVLFGINKESAGDFTERTPAQGAYSSKPSSDGSDDRRLETSVSLPEPSASFNHETRPLASITSNLFRRFYDYTENIPQQNPKGFRIRAICIFVALSVFLFLLGSNFGGSIIIMFLVFLLLIKAV